jgi:hypothetical protein
MAPPNSPSPLKVWLIIIAAILLALVAALARYLLYQL